MTNIVTHLRFARCHHVDMSDGPHWSRKRDGRKAPSGFRQPTRSQLQALGAEVDLLRGEVHPFLARGDLKNKADSGDSCLFLPGANTFSAGSHPCTFGQALSYIHRSHISTSSASNHLIAFGILCWQQVRLDNALLFDKPSIEFRPTMFPKIECLRYMSASEPVQNQGQI